MLVEHKKLCGNSLAFDPKKERTYELSNYSYRKARQNLQNFAKQATTIKCIKYPGL
jgi:hypothetical protein